MALVNKLRKIKILPIGSCRIYRPFMKSVSGVIVSNTFDEIEVVYPKFGFFHSIAEICQVTKLLINGINNIDFDIRTKLFRKEPIPTTPYNEFSESIWIDGCFDEHVVEKIKEIDCIIIEVSSLTCFKCEKSGMFLHWNPNYSSNLSYSDIYPVGYYEKTGMGSHVKKIECDELFVTNSLKEISELFPKAKIIVTAHINDKSSHTRKNLNKIIKDSVSRVENLVFFDNKKVFEKFGYNVTNQQYDIHHLSNFGEKQVGLELQNMVLKNEY